MGTDPRGQTDRQTQLKTLLWSLSWRLGKMSANPISQLQYSHSSISKTTIVYAIVILQPITGINRP